MSGEFSLASRPITLLGTSPKEYEAPNSQTVLADCAQVARRAGALSGLSIDVGTAVLPNGCGMLVRALGTAASQVRAALLKIWGVLKAC